MITKKINKNVIVMINGEVRNEIEWFCKSNATMPKKADDADLYHACLLYQFDTGKVFMFDYEDDAWIEQ